MLAQPSRITHTSFIYAECVKSNLWICQHKLNGIRTVVKCDDISTTAETKYGNPVALDPMPIIPPGTILDGEKYNEEFYAFDCLAYAGTNIYHIPLEMRLDYLDLLNIECVPAIPNKYNCLYIAAKEKSEGVVFKHLRKPYPNGKTVDWLKVLLP